MLSVEFAQLSDRGTIREQNEDSLGHVLPANREQARSHGWLFAVADGVGGQDLGEVASNTAVETLLEGFRRAPKDESHSALLSRLVQQANTRVYETGRSTGPSGVAMATTIVACVLRFDRVVVAHVGDSRCYMIRQGHAHSLTRDHTVANEQRRMGLPLGNNRHVLSRSLGSDLFVAVDTSVHLLAAGDILLLCSDGLYGSVTASDMARVTGECADLHAAARELVALANERDGSDNVSLQLIRIRGVERVGMYRGRPYKLR